MNFNKVYSASASLFIALVLNACSGGGSSDTTSAVAPAPVTLFATNDVHGYISTTDAKSGINSRTTLPTSTNPAGVTVNTGGLAYMATLLKNLTTQATATGANTLFVAAGDLVGASAYDSAFAKDEPTVSIMSKMGLAVTSVGNHEFDRGITDLLRIANTSNCFPGGTAGQNTCVDQPGNVFPGASFKYLASNVTYNSTGPTPGGNPLPPTFVKTFAGANGAPGATIGFIGAVFKNTPNEVLASGVSSLTFGDESAAINAQSKALRAQGVNAVVVLIHQGGQTTSTVYGDTTCPGFSGDIVPIVANLTSDVDLVVSGHTHNDYICKLPNASGKLIPVTQSGYYGQGITSINLTFAKNGSVASITAVNNPVINDTNTTLPADLKALAPDATIASAITGYTTLSGVQGNVGIGYISAAVLRQLPPAGCATAGTCDSGSRDKTLESAIGNLTADAFLASNPAVQISMNQAGAVRADLKSPTDPSGYPYNVTYANIQTTDPFNNNLVSFDLTGAQIKAILEQQWELNQCNAFFAPGGKGEIIYVSKGFTYSWDAAQPACAPTGTGNRVIASSMKLNGVPISMTQTYRVNTTNFLASAGLAPGATAGDFFTGFSVLKNPVYGGIDSQAVQNYVATFTAANPYVPLQPVEGQFRIRKFVGSVDCGYGASWHTPGTCFNNP